MRSEANMQETLTNIQSDSTLLLITGIAIVVLLAIVLVVVVSAMRIKVYKDRFKNLFYENKEKIEYIDKVEKELQECKIKNAKNEQELAQFDETKRTLKKANESYLSLQDMYNENEKELSQIKAKLESLDGMYTSLIEEHKHLQERFDVTQDENLKYRINNTRLLMKLEQEERYDHTLEQKKETKG